MVFQDKNVSPTTINTRDASLKIKDSYERQQDENSVIHSSSLIKSSKSKMTLKEKAAAFYQLADVKDRKEPRNAGRRNEKQRRTSRVGAVADALSMSAHGSSHRRQKVYRTSFVGKEIIDSLVNEGVCQNREEAVLLGNRLARLNLFTHVNSKRKKLSKKKRKNAQFAQNMLLGNVDNDEFGIDDSDSEEFSDSDDDHDEVFFDDEFAFYTFGKGALQILDNLSDKTRENPRTISASPNKTNKNHPIVQTREDFIKQLPCPPFAGNETTKKKRKKSIVPSTCVSSSKKNDEKSDEVIVTSKRKSRKIKYISKNQQSMEDTKKLTNSSNSSEKILSVPSLSPPPSSQFLSPLSASATRKKKKKKVSSSMLQSPSTKKKNKKDPNCISKSLSSSPSSSSSSPSASKRKNSKNIPGSPSPSLSLSSSSKKKKERMSTTLSSSTPTKNSPKKISSSKAKKKEDGLVEKRRKKTRKEEKDQMVKGFMDRLNDLEVKLSTPRPTPLLSKNPSSKFQPSSTRNMKIVNGSENNSQTDLDQLISLLSTDPSKFQPSSIRNMKINKVSEGNSQTDLDQLVSRNSILPTENSDDWTAFITGKPSTSANANTTTMAADSSENEKKKAKKKEKEKKERKKEKKKKKKMEKMEKKSKDGIVETNSKADCEVKRSSKEESEGEIDFCPMDGDNHNIRIIANMDKTCIFQQFHSDENDYDEISYNDSDSSWTEITITDDDKMEETVVGSCTSASELNERTSIPLNFIPQFVSSLSLLGDSSFNLASTFDRPKLSSSKGTRRLASINE